MSGIGKPLVSANGGVGKIVEGPPEGTPRGLGDAMRRLIDFSEKVKSDHSLLFVSFARIYDVCLALRSCAIWAIFNPGHLWHRLAEGETVIAG